MTSTSHKMIPREQW